MQNIEFLKGKIEEKKWQVQGFRRKNVSWDFFIDMGLEWSQD